MSESSTNATSTHYSRQKKQISKKAVYLTKTEIPQPVFPEFIKNELLRRSMVEMRDRQADVRASPERIGQVKSKVVRNIMTRLKVQRRTLMDQIASAHNNKDQH